MTAPKRRWSFSLRMLFAVTLSCGLWQLFLGFVLLPVMPYFQLDHVLTPEELTDDATRERTLELLKKAADGGWSSLILPGLIICAASVSGLYRLKLPRDDISPPPATHS